MLNNEDRIVSSPELLTELQTTQEDVFKVNTGIRSLDRILDGVEAGELIIVSGPTGNGKTTALLTITQNMVKDKVDSLWFTLEVTPRQFINKISKADGNLPFFYLPRRGFEDVSTELIQWFEKEHKRRFEMIDWIGIKIEEAITRAKSEDRNIKVVFIDHIHQIFSLARVDRNVSLEIGDMVAKIKDIALKNNLIIFLVAHSKDDPQGTAREPRMQDIRDSGLISRLADTVIGIWRIPNDDDGTSTRLKQINEKDNKSKIRVWKNRREGTLGFFTMYHRDGRLTEDVDWGENW